MQISARVKLRSTWHMLWRSLGRGSGTVRGVRFQWDGRMFNSDPLSEVQAEALRDAPGVEIVMTAEPALASPAPHKPVDPLLAAIGEVHLAPAIPAPPLPDAPKRLPGRPPAKRAAE